MEEETHLTILHLCAPSSSVRPENVNMGNQDIIMHDDPLLCKTPG